jgi:RNA polymerase sigma factor (sigma-70 family)
MLLDLPRRPLRTTMDPENPELGCSFEHILAAARAGDDRAVDALAARFYPTVQRLVHQKLTHELRANRPWLAARFSTGDVVQEVFQGVLRDLGAFAGPDEDAFVGYLAMVVRNRIVDAIRFHEADRRDVRRGSPPPTELDLAAPPGDPARSVEERELVDRVMATLETFEPRERLLVRARLEDTASFAELTRQLGYGSESAARRAFYAAQAKLTLALKER